MANFKVEQQNYTDQLDRIDDKSQKYVLDGMKIDPVANTNPSDNWQTTVHLYFRRRQKRTQRRTMTASRRRSNSHNPMHVQPAHNGHFRPPYKAVNNHPVDQYSYVPDLPFIRPVNEVFADDVDYRNYALIKKPTWHEDEVRSDVIKMTRKAVLQMKDQIHRVETHVNFRLSKGFQGSF